MSHHDNHAHADGHLHEHHHDHSLASELVCHLPYAIFSVAFGLAILSFLSAITIGQSLDPKLAKKGAKILFHSFHFMHLVFATSGTLITFFRFSTNVSRGLLVGLVSPSIFCMFSDAILPYLGGRILGIPMHFHICFISELHNVLPFLFVGLLSGLITRWNHAANQSSFALTSHAAHIFVSSMASIFYLVSHGFTAWYEQIGFVFLFLVIAVVVPCTLSDVVVPMSFARMGHNNEKPTH